MARIETDPDRLQRRLAELETLRGASLSALQADALSECAFRIAVHPSTAATRTVELLQLAMRTDSANPRYSYHMARVHFRNGDLQQAAVWLDRARKLCPTSHRIWVHIGLLQREVNEGHNRKYRETKGYLQDEHRHRWKEIAEAIQKGEDQFSLKLARFEPDLDQKKVAEVAGIPEEEPILDAPETGEEIVQRLTNAGVCRWSRIGDLIAEDLLEADAGPRTRDSLRGLLENAAMQTPSRVGGGALFAILGIEWMVRGYSAEFVLRIRPKALDGTPAGRLLEEVRKIFETPTDGLPAAIAAALGEGRIPPILAAAIHRLVVFGSPLNPSRLIADLREWRAAVSQGSDEDCARWLGTVGEHLKGLDVKPFAPVADFPPESEKRVASPEAVLSELRRGLEQTQQDAKSFRAWLDGHKTNAPDTFSAEEIAEVGRIRQFVKGVQSVKEKATVELKRLRDSGKVQGLADSIQDIENGFQNVNPRALTVILSRAPFNTISTVSQPAEEAATAPTAGALASSASVMDAVLKAPQVTSGDAPHADNIAEIETIRRSLTDCRSRLQALKRAGSNPEGVAVAIAGAQQLLEISSARAAELLTQAASFRDQGRIGGGETTGDADRTEKLIQDLQPVMGPIRVLIEQLSVALPTGPADSVEERINERSVRTKLVDAVREVEAKLIGVYENQAQSISAYAGHAADEPAIQAVRMSINARKADILFRLGKRDEARREWAALLTEDIYDLRLLRNLAVVDTIDGDVQRSQTSWRSYVEMLYFQAAILQDATHRAPEREAFHQNYGNAYGLKHLYEDRNVEKQKSDPTDLIAFMNSPTRVSLYIRHQLLAVLNRRLNFRMPPLILGVSRSATEPVREQAFEKIKKWSADLCAELPKRAGARFSDAVSLRLRAAADEMKSAKRMRDLAGRVDYQEEHARYLQWIVDVFRWKVRLHNLIQELSVVSDQAGFLDLLAEFAEVDSIPLDTSEELLQAVAVKMSTSPEVVCSLLGHSGLNAWLGALRLVFPAHGHREADNPDDRKTLYAKLTDDLERAQQHRPWPESPGANLLAEARRFIDNPGYVSQLEFYPPKIHSALENKNPDSNDLEWMQREHQLFPKSGGISFHYSVLLAHAEDFVGAKRVAAEGVSQGLDERSREQCQDILRQLALM